MYAELVGRYGTGLAATRRSKHGHVYGFSIGAGRLKLNPGPPDHFSNVLYLFQPPKTFQ